MSNTRTRKNSKAQQDEQPQPQAEPEQPQATGPAPEDIAIAKSMFEELAVGKGGLGEGVRVRVHFEDRKMAVPGRIHLRADGTPELHTNWGLKLNLAAEPVTKIEVKDLDSGRFVAL
jgi:hypothetical protein